MKKFGFLFLFIGSFSFAQDHLSGFNMTSLTYKFSPKWTAYVELQTRARRDYTIIDYYETKGGVGYNFNKNNQIFVGIGKYGTYEKRKISQEEIRLWLQYIFTQRIGALKIDHRLRAEQRFFHANNTGENSTAQRFRYRLSGTLPINNDKVESKTVFVNAFEEVFLGPKSPVFKRNRMFAGIGYQFNDVLSSTIGYMFQREFSNKGNDNFHFLNFSLNFTINSYEKERNLDAPLGD